MPGLVPLLSRSIPADGARDMSTSGFSTVRASRDTNFGAPASPVAVTLLPAVMAGLVPLLSGLSRANRARGLAAGGLPAHRPNRGSDCGRLAPPVRVPCCHPGLVPGSRLSGTALARLPPDRGPGQAWTPEQVRGDSRGSRNGLVHRQGARPKVKPDSNGLVPAIHVSPHRGARREGTRRWPHVDARNKSGHDDKGGMPEDTRTGGPRLPSLRRSSRS